MLSKIANMETKNPNSSSLKLSAESLVQQVSEFCHDLEYNRIFANWLPKCEDVLRNDLTDIPDDEKWWLLLRLGV